jgi:hypothetical protein
VEEPGSPASPAAVHAQRAARLQPPEKRDEFASSQLQLVEVHLIPASQGRMQDNSMVPADDRADW